MTAWTSGACRVCWIPGTVGPCCGISVSAPLMTTVLLTFRQVPEETLYGAPQMPMGFLSRRQRLQGPLYDSASSTTRSGPLRAVSLTRTVRAFIHCFGGVPISRENSASMPEFGPFWNARPGGGVWILPTEPPGYAHPMT